MSLDDVPSIIKDNKNIKDSCAYWASLPQEAKSKYLQKQADIEKLAAKIEENKKAEEQRKQREIEEIEEIKQRKMLPLTEQYTREQAIALVSNIRKLSAKSTIARDLIKSFNLTEDELNNMTIT